MSLIIEGLGVSHDGAAVLRDVSLRVGAGESLCLVGASGGGKSLVAQAVAGLLPACMTAVGRIGLGLDVRLAGDQSGLRSLWGRSCVLPQEPGRALAAFMRAEDQVGLAPPEIGRAAARTWLARFGLDATAAGRRPGALSGGMAQRLLVALLARTPAPVLVLDEPTTGLDPVNRAALVDALRVLRADGRALLVITHDLVVVRALGGGLAVLEGGRIVEEGRVDALLERPGSGFLRACVAADPASWGARMPGAAGATVAAAEGLVIGRGRPVAGPVELGLQAGRVAAVLGASGAGKTTLGDTLLGLTAPRGGRVTWFGRTLDAGRQRALRPRFQKLHQDPTSVFPADRSLGATLADLRLLPDGRAAVARLPDLLERLRVDRTVLERRPGAVSGGEAQRVALARALALRPALLVADEPASRLDRPVQGEALRLLRELADEDGLAVMLITHDRAVADALADRVLELGGGGRTRLPGVMPGSEGGLR